MNFLAHHTVALRAVADASVPPPAYFVGVALPDLLSVSGEGRLRAISLPADERSTPLTRGAALHLATDKRFHGLASFAEAQTEAAQRLRSTSFSFPLRRMFFLAHVLVEIAFDGYLLKNNPQLANDFYAQFEQADLVAVVDETHTLLQAGHPLLGLARTLEGFLHSGYLRHYDTGAGQAEALSRVCFRAGLSPFDDDRDRAALTAVFDAFLPSCGKWAEDFLTVP